MSQISIKVENLSKAYQIGEIGTGTISHDLERWFAKIRGKEDPLLKIGEKNDRSKKGESNIVWSLKDINFEINKGDAVGIIGRNGAGKSTLLKILSKVTAPTTGKISGNGRIASLLEVGTGFHPELTGRENIFLNGAILGMKKKEILRKFDEIVDFSGVERYVDTPVKRYSSGMYVRLAFAVAAHLESEILIVDEVLAVGDAEFQKKCLGKMGEVSKGEGRTVLFVSHNMNSIRALCSKGIYLKNGLNSGIDDINNVINEYSLIDDENSEKNELINFKKNEKPYLSINSIQINNSTSNNIFVNQDNNVLEIEISGHLKEFKKIAFEFILHDKNLIPLLFYSPTHFDGKNCITTSGDFTLKSKINLPNNINRGHYIGSLFLTDPGFDFHVKFEYSINLISDGFMMKNGHVFDYNNGAGFLFIK